MKTTIWLLFGMLALLWTGGIAVTAEVARWAIHALASGNTVDLAELLSRGPMPVLVAMGFDPALLKQAMAFLLATIDSLLPLIGAAAGWITPLLWLCWAVVLVLMLAATGVAHLLLTRLSQRESPTR